MSTENDVARSLRSWLREDRHEDADRVLDAVFDQVPATPQRSPSWLARRFPPMNNYARFAIAAAVVVVAAFVAINLLPGMDRHGGPPTATPTATPEATPTAFSSTPAGGPLDPGSIVLDGAFPLAIVFDVPAGWTRDGATEAADLVGIHKIHGDSAPAYSSWAIVANVYADPCHASSGPINPPIGPTVDDLVAALTSMVGFEATAPTAVTIDGHAGKRFEVSTTIDPATDGCDDDVWLSLWEPSSGSDTARVPGAVAMQLWVLDVDGTRLLMFTEDYGATPTEIAEAIAIMDSVRFQ